MIARPLDPAIKPWPAQTGGLDPPAAALELGRQQIEGEDEEDPEQQDDQSAGGAEARGNVAAADIERDQVRRASQSLMVSALARASRAFRS